MPLAQAQEGEVCLLMEHRQYGYQHFFEPGQPIWFLLKNPAHDWQKGVLLEVSEAGVVIQEAGAMTGNAYAFAEINGVHSRPLAIAMVKIMGATMILGGQFLIVNGVRQYQQAANVGALSMVMIGATLTLMGAMPWIIKPHRSSGPEWEFRSVPVSAMPSFWEILLRG